MDKNWIKIAAIFVGTVIGAGFASGREIIEFFGVYGTKGLWGIYIVGILFSTCASILLFKIYKYKIRDLDHLLESFFSKKMKKMIDILITISLYTGFSIMISGSGALFKEQFSLSLNIGIIVMLIFSFLVFLFSLGGFSIVNTILVPILILGIIFISLYLSRDGGYDIDILNGVDLTSKGNFITSSFLYFGSNSLIIIVVFSSLLPLLKDKNTAILGGITGGIILFFLAISLLKPLLIYYEKVKDLEIPMLYISSLLGTIYKKVYAILLWIAMFTTALANGFGFINKFHIKQKSPIFLFCISAIPLAKFGFANLVGIIYPLFGVLGVIMMIKILFTKKLKATGKR